MDPIEALLTRKLDELESELFSLENAKEPTIPQPQAAALLSKLSFLKYLLSAEIGGNNASIRLSHITARISSLESIFSAADDPKTLRLDILRKNLRELESMASENFCHQSEDKIRRKIDFTKSVLVFQDQSEDLSSLSERISVAEEDFVRLSADNGTQGSCSSTSRQGEGVGEEESVALSLRKKTGEIEKDGNVDDDDDGAPIQVGYLGHFLEGEMKWKEEEKTEELDGVVNGLSSIGSEVADPNGLIDDDAIGSNGSSSCSCTSACFDEGEEMHNQAEEEEEEENTVSTVSETEELCSLETEKVMEGRGETAGYGGRDGAWRFLKLISFGAMVGTSAVAAIGVGVGVGVGVLVGRFFSDEEMVNLEPT